MLLNSEFKSEALGAYIAQLKRQNWLDERQNKVLSAGAHDIDVLDIDFLNEDQARAFNQAWSEIEKENRLHWESASIKRKEIAEMHQHEQIDKFRPLEKLIRANIADLACMYLRKITGIYNRSSLER